MKHFNKLKIFSFGLFVLSILFAGSAFSQIPDRDVQYLEEANAIKNGGFENGLVLWSSTGSAPSLQTTAADVGRGKASATWDATATGHTLSSQQATLANRLDGNLCHGSLWYKDGDANIDAKVIDGSANELVSVTLATASVWTKVELPFTCPSSDTVGIVLEATANSAEITIDDAFIGYKKYAQSGEPGLINYYNKTVLSGNGDLSGSSVAKVERINDQVTITAIVNNGFTHSSSSGPASNAGLVPEWARPAVNQSNIYVGNASFIYRVIVSSNGTLTFRYLDPGDGTPTNTVNTQNFSITYSVGTN